ncbi:MAG: hypothetical protein GTN72_01460 [Candidatus Latescibacteria bacterium]|nr:hypothetical protein [Candidatus Latescibacterota bacterium]
MITLLPRAAEHLRQVHQAAIDFLIENRCVLCGASTGQPGAARSSGPFSRCLRRPVHLKVFGVIPLENKPICERCLSCFDETRSAGNLGRFHVGNHVAMVSKQRFGQQPEGSPSDEQEPGVKGLESPPEPTARSDIRVIAPFMTDDHVLKLIHLVKFSRYTALIPHIARTIQQALETFLEPESGQWVLVPVPMIRKDEKRRGFNQAERLGWELSRLTGITMDSSALRRRRRGRPQSQTAREKRAENVRGAFIAYGSRIAEKHVLLVDDLVTSGATAAECAKALLQSGAASVAVLCFGRSL